MSAVEVNAQAYAVGNHVAFADGKYDPISTKGRSLLAHELTHVLQQQLPPRHETRSEQDGSAASLELEAEANENRISSTGPLTVVGTAGRHRLSKKEADPEELAAPDATAESNEMLRLQQVLQQIHDSIPLSEFLTAGITTPSQYRSQMFAGARTAADQVKDKLTENWVDESDEQEVISTLTVWAKVPKIERGNYLDDILDYLKDRTLVMDYLVAESAPSNYLDQLFEEMEDERASSLRSLLQNYSSKYNDYRPGRGVSITGSLPSAVINELRSLQKKVLQKLRGWAKQQSGAARVAADIIINQVEVISDLLISLILGIVGILHGIISELYSMIEGLLKIAYGIVKAVALFLYGFVDGGQQFDQYMNEIVATLKAIPSALRQVIDQWMKEFKQASADEQRYMIGQLTGRIIATITTLGFAAGKAGKFTLALPKPVVALQSQLGGTATLALESAGTLSVPVGQLGGTGTVLAASAVGHGTDGTAAKKDGPETSKTKPKKEKRSDFGKAPAPAESEVYVQQFLERSLPKGKWKMQEMFLDGKRVTKRGAMKPRGSTIPDSHSSVLNVAVEVKTWSVADTPFIRLIKKNIIGQQGSRSISLPSGTKQWLFIDMRGQGITNISQHAQMATKELKGIFDRVYFITDEGFTSVL